MAGTGTIAGIMKSVLLKTEELKFFCAARCFATLRGPQVVEVTPGEWDFERERDRARAFVLPLPLFWNGSELGPASEGFERVWWPQEHKMERAGILRWQATQNLYPGPGKCLEVRLAVSGFAAGLCCTAG